LMANEQAPAVVSTIDVKSVLAELAVPFSPDQVQWRVTNTAKDKKRGQIVPYADPRAYADRLNALFTPQGWTRKYKIEKMSNRPSNGPVPVFVWVRCSSNFKALGLILTR